MMMSAPARRLAKTTTTSIYRLSQYSTKPKAHKGYNTAKISVLKSKPATSVKPFRPYSPSKIPSGWTTTQLLFLLATVASISGYGSSVLFSNCEKDYSRPGKFGIPKYGTVKDMENVSSITCSKL